MLAELVMYIITSARAEIIVNTSFSCVFVFHFFQFVFETQQPASHKSQVQQRSGPNLSCEIRENSSTSRLYCFSPDLNWNFKSAYMESFKPGLSFSSLNRAEIDLRSAYVTRFSMHINYKVIFSRMFATLHCSSLFNSGVT